MKKTNEGVHPMQKKIEDFMSLITGNENVKVMSLDEFLKENSSDKRNCVCKDSDPLNDVYETEKLSAGLLKAISDEVAKQLQEVLPFKNDGIERELNIQINERDEYIEDLKDEIHDLTQLNESIQNELYALVDRYAMLALKAKDLCVTLKRATFSPDELHKKVNILLQHCK